MKMIPEFGRSGDKTLTQAFRVTEFKYPANYKCFYCVQLYTPNVRIVALIP